MDFSWQKYDSSYANLVDSWLDDEAVRLTGLDDGWQEFYNYWTKENEKYPGCKDFCYIVSYENKPFAVIYLGVCMGKMVVSEIIIDPKNRGKGYGTRLLVELLENHSQLVCDGLILAETVIFPSNIASQKAFSKAGFHFRISDSEDDSWNYEYKF